MSKRRSVHVTPVPDGRWQINRRDSDRALSVHRTRREAEDAARRTARREGVEIVVHGRDGRIRDAAVAREPARRLGYTVVFEPQSGGGYTVLVPALPGCLTEGDTLAEARRNAREAIQVYCESLLSDGLTLPRDIRRPLLHEKVVVTVGGP